MERFSLSPPDTNFEADSQSPSSSQTVWKERQEATGALERYLTDLPS